jgi:hypothetical protein
MQWTTLRNSLVATALLLSLSACSSPPPGPVQPDVGPKAPGVLTIEPALKPYLDVPSAQQNYSYNNLGFLEYNTQVRNKGSQAMTLSFVADFYDEHDRLTESQAPIRFFIDPNSIKPLQIAANNKESKRMEVQVRPAK